MVLYVKRLLTNYWLYAVIVLVLVFGVNAVQTAFIYQITRGTPLAEESPRLVMRDVHINNFEADGKLDSSIEAEGLAQFVNNSVSAVEPRIVMFRDSMPLVYISAKRVDVREANMQFLEKVHVTLPQIQGIGNVRTNQLDYDREHKTITTKEVDMEYASDFVHSMLHATSLHMDIKDQKLWFAGKVTTQIQLHENP